MIKKFKFKIISFIVFAFTFSVINFCAPTKNNFEAYAVQEKCYNYVLSNSALNQINTIKVVGIYNDNSEYILGENFANFDSVFTAISNDLLEDQKSLNNTNVNLIFESNFAVYDDWIINLPSGNITLIGNILSTTSNTVFKFNKLSSGEYNFDSLSVTSSAKHIIEILSSNINITVSNSTFASSNLDSYAFYFENSSCNFCFKNLNNHSTTYFMNYSPSIIVSFNNFISPQNKIIITAPSNLNLHTFTTNINSSITRSIDIISQNNAYYIQQIPYWSSADQELKINSMINLDTNLNGGNLNNSISSSFNYGKLFEITAIPAKVNNYFAGWYGACQIDEITYYFDSQMLHIAELSNFDKTALKTIFKTNLGGVDSEYSISKFFGPDDFSIAENFIELYETLDQTPTIIAKWEYQLDINTTGGDKMNPMRFCIDTIANIPTPTKEGYSFKGWYLDENLTIACDFSSINTNDTIYASWQINDYQITFYYDENESQFETQCFTFGDEITFPAFSKVGHKIIGWKTTNSIFESSSMPGTNLTLYAIWEKEEYLTSFETDSNLYISPIHSKYQESIEKPTDPTKLGYTFIGWVDQNTNLPFDFSETPAYNRTAVATWIANTYVATFIFNNSFNQNVKFGETITYIPLNPGYKFLGWYDSNDEKIDTMPATNITLYAKWQQKNLIDLNLSTQSQTIDSQDLKYKIEHTFRNFIIEYYVDDEWTTSVPETIGTYDIKVTRSEDDNFAAYEQILLNGYQILPKHIDLKIIYTIIFALIFIEIVAIIAVKWLTKQKRSTPLAYSIIFPFAMFDTNEFIITIIATVLLIITSIWLIRSLVILHNTIPDPTPESPYNNRATIKKIDDSTNDLEIEQKVEELLVKNKLIKPNNNKKTIKVNTDENIEPLTLFDDNKNSKLE